MIKNFDYCKYTYLHRKALEYYIKTNKYLTNEERDELLRRAKIHDMDKLTLYLFWEKKDASNYHRTTTTHHIKENKMNYAPNEMDYLECIFDCECAALTKSDKPYNANDTFLKWYPEYYDVFLPLLQRLHMDSSYSAITEDAINYINTFDVTEDIILDEIAIYLAENKENIYTVLKDKCCLECEYKTLLQRYDKYCLEKFRTFYKDSRKEQKYLISVDILNSQDLPMFSEKNIKGKLIVFTSGNKEKLLYNYFIINSNDIYGYISSKNYDLKDLSYFSYEKPLLMQLSEEEYMCNCGTKFYGKRSHCCYCNQMFVY